jgi:hypothetical protein
MHAFPPAHWRRHSCLDVSASEATALRDVIATLMTGYGDIAVAVDEGRWIDARQRRWRMECLARLLDDLGWSSESAPTAITAPPAQLLVALEAISLHCAQMLEVGGREIAAASGADRYRDSLAVCASLRGRIDIVVACGVR